MCRFSLNSDLRSEGDGGGGGDGDRQVSLAVAVTRLCLHIWEEEDPRLSAASLNKYADSNVSPRHSHLALESVVGCTDV